MRIGNADLRELRITRNRAERNEHADDTKYGVRHCAENGEPQRWAVAQQRKITLHCHVMIEADSGNWNQSENRRRDTGGDHPGRKRSIDETLHSRPTRKERVRPKTNRRQMITVNGAADYFWNHVIGRA